MRSNFTLPITVLALVMLTCAWIAVYPLQGTTEHLGISFFLGSLFGHSLLTSGWIALGPGGWYRVPLALVWCLAFPCDYVINTTLYQFHPASSIAWISASMTILVVQTLAWPMRFCLGLQIGKPVFEQDGHSESIASRQFGIQHLIIVTTVVAMIIGGGRLLLPYLSKWLVTGGPDWLHLTLINAFSLLPVLIVSIALRLADYQLSATRERTELKSDTQRSVN